MGLRYAAKLPAKSFQDDTEQGIHHCISVVAPCQMPYACIEAEDRLAPMAQMLQCLASHMSAQAKPQGMASTALMGQGLGPRFQRHSRPYDSSGRDVTRNNHA